MSIFNLAAVPQIPSSHLHVPGWWLLASVLLLLAALWCWLQSQTESEDLRRFGYLAGTVACGTACFSALVGAAAAMFSDLHLPIAPGAALVLFLAFILYIWGHQPRRY